METGAEELRRIRRGWERQVCRGCRRRLLLVVPELEQEVRAILDGMDAGSWQLFEQEYELHVIDPGVLPVLTLPAGSVVIRDREGLEALRGVIEALVVDPELFPPRSGGVRRQR